MVNGCFIRGFPLWNRATVKYRLNLPLVLVDPFVSEGTVFIGIDGSSTYMIKILGDYETIQYHWLESLTPETEKSVTGSKLLMSVVEIRTCTLELALHKIQLDLDFMKETVLVVHHRFLHTCY